ncbi:MAG: hypothetical protein R3C01_07240 [Planctomycetaceae bacterium]
MNRFFSTGLTAFLAGAWMACPGTLALGQVTVQQPVVQVFGVDTVVSVPDRGSVLLGGVSSARDGRNTSGFMPWGSSIGMDRNYSSARATAYIHDFEEMEAELLGGLTPLDQLASPWSNRHAEHAYMALMKRPASAGSQPVNLSPATSVVRIGTSPMVRERTEVPENRVLAGQPVSRIRLLREDAPEGPPRVDTVQSADGGRANAARERLLRFGTATGSRR